MIGIIDYGMGNLGSVSNALSYLNVEHMICDTKEKIAQCDKLILPGVGAFAQAMETIQEKDLYACIDTCVKNHVPLLGICLGMPMLFDTSEEKGLHQGFGWIKGNVVKIQETALPIPEIGWNALVYTKECRLKEIVSDPYVYYVHSYYAQVENAEDLVAYSMYGNTKVAGIVRKGNVIGTQFHPEKSGEDGLKILKYFVEEFV